VLHSRIEEPKRKYSLEIISKLIKHEYVYISSEQSNMRILKHYSQFKLFESKAIEQESFNGVLVKKILNESLKSRIRKL
jgi:hypothetical protein